MNNNRRGIMPLRPPDQLGRVAQPKPQIVEQLPIAAPMMEYQPVEEAKHVHTTPTPLYYSKIRYFLVVAGFLFISLFVAFFLVISINGSKQHQLGQQPHMVRQSAPLGNYSEEAELYWEFSLSSGLQTWQEIPAQGPIPGLIAPKGSVRKFEVSCTTVDGITLSKGAGFDALSFDARLRYLPINGDIKLLFYANNIELMNAQCTLFVKINPQF